jgi:hypothetical protein
MELEANPSHAAGLHEFLRGSEVDMEWWNRRHSLLRVCLALGAFVGALLGGEMLTGLGAGWQLLGCLTGGAAGVVLGAYGISARHKSMVQEERRLSCTELERRPDDLPSEQGRTKCNHVERMLTEREVESQRAPGRT